MPGKKPRIAVTMGDPAGVGPEICLRLIAEEAIASLCTPIVFGDAGVLHRVADSAGLPPPERMIGPADWHHLKAELDAPTVVDLRPPGMSGIGPGEVSIDAGRASWTFIEAALEAAQAGDVDAVTTAPINKLALSKAGVPFQGHTEIFAHHTGAERHCMMQYSDEVTVSFVTCHVGIEAVPALITEARVFDTIELSAGALRLLPERPPTILVCGLNPHAGEGGLFGRGEEESAIIPAIERARAAGIAVEGPVPPDTAFLPARRAASGCTVCMYHDQGHIPLKALAFERAVNITLGLPIVRTSVDHGTAFDIAWQGLADPGSLFEAIHLATQFVSNKDEKVAV